MRNNFEILLHSFLWEAIVSSTGMDRVILSFTMSIQHFLCPQWHHPFSKVPRRMVLKRLSWHVTCLNHSRRGLKNKNKNENLDEVGGINEKGNFRQQVQHTKLYSDTLGLKRRNV